MYFIAFTIVSIFFVFFILSFLRCWRDVLLRCLQRLSRNWTKDHFLFQKWWGLFHLLFGGRRKGVCSRGWGGEAGVQNTFHRKQRSRSLQNPRPVYRVPLFKFSLNGGKILCKLPLCEVPSSLKPACCLVWAYQIETRQRLLVYKSLFPHCYFLFHG